MTYDKNAVGSNQMQLFVNGTLAASANYTTAISTNANNFVIGDAFTGTLDEVRLYNRALTPQEISDQYLLNKRGN